MRDKGVATAVATLLAAFATAHLMQFGLSAGRAITGEAPSTPIGLATLVALRNDGVLAELPPTPSTAPDPIAVALGRPVARVPARDEAVSLAPAAERTDGFGVSCDRTLSLLSLPGAVLEARVEAPCDPGVRVELGHAGLRFAVLTDAEGRAVARVPALTPDATIEVAFADGASLSAKAEVPEVADMERVALVADGWAGMTLHAASTGSWREERTLAGSGVDDEEILRLGETGIEAPLFAQVYSTPAGRFGSLAPTGLRVEAALTPANCARDVSATVVRSTGGVIAAPIALRLSLPACDSDGGVLVVGLPLPGLRLERYSAVSE